MPVPKLPVGSPVLALLFSGLVLSQAWAAESQGGPKSISELQSAIEKVLKETKTPGAGIAIVSRDKVEWTAGIGKADVAANRPATADTLFRIGSVSKGFSALAALQLQEQHKLQLTNTVKQWVPEVAFENRWESSDPVRLVHLMEHTSGFDDIHLREYALSDPKITLREALDFGAPSRVCRWRPGTRCAYCNSGPAVLAAVIEKASGQPFEQYVHDHFFRPLHMETASYFYTPEVQQQIATLYQADGVTPSPYWHIAYRPAGSINASALDMANYVRFYLQRGSFDGVELLQPSSIERMEHPESLPSAKLGEMAGYGLYNYTMLEGPFVFHGHQGGVNGGLTEMAYLPEQGWGYAFMINSGQGGALFRISKLVRQYIVRDLTPPPLPPVVSIPSDLRQHYSGYFQNISPRAQISYWLTRLVYVKRLAFTTNGLSTTTYGFGREDWVPVTGRLFRQKDQSLATLALLPDADGDVLMQTAWSTYRKISGIRAWGEPLAIGTTILVMVSASLLAIVRLVRRVFWKRIPSGPRSVRRIPLMTTWLLGAFWGILYWAVKEGNIWTLGVCSWLTLTIMSLSLAFATSAGASLYFVYRARSAQMNRLAYGYAVLVSLAVALSAIYMGYWGLIGIRLWAP